MKEGKKKIIYEKKPSGVKKEIPSVKMSIDDA